PGFTSNRWAFFVPCMASFAMAGAPSPALTYRALYRVLPAAPTHGASTPRARSPGLTTSLEGLITASFAIAGAPSPPLPHRVRPSQRASTPQARSPGLTPVEGLLRASFAVAGAPSPPLTYRVLLKPSQR